MYDLVKWMCMPSTSAGFRLTDGTPYGRETHHLEGLNLLGSKVIQYPRDTGSSLWFTKTAQGYPWDIKPYDSNFIYDRVTELDWNFPSDFKQFNPPLAMCPRLWDGDPTWNIYHPTSNYEVWQNCVKVNSASVGEVLYTLEGPYAIDFQGMVGLTPAILLSYYWNNFSDREQLFLTRRFGWVKWTHAALQISGRYSVDAASLHNQVVAGQVTPKFPCFPIP